jgi:hypothetical protein
LSGLFLFWRHTNASQILAMNQDGTDGGLGCILILSGQQQSSGVLIYW